MMTANFTVIDDWNDNQEYHHTVEGTEEDFQRMRNMTPDDLLKYLHDECVGKCNTKPRSEQYFIPKLVFGNMKVSAQVNYYLWSDRDDRDYDFDHTKIITEEEFSARYNNYYEAIDVMILVNDSKAACGSMYIYKLTDFINQVAWGCEPKIPYML